MKFGIIGYGRMGQLYQNVLDSLKIEVTFICDKKNQTDKKNFFYDYKKAINKSNVDGIIISTYGPSHYEIIEYAIKKNIKYIVCEKPFTTSVKHADDLVKLLKSSNTRLNVNYLRRYSPIYKKLKIDLKDKKIIGSPRSIVITSGAGGISALGTHFLDLCRLILDSKVKSVYAYPIDKKLPNPRGVQFKDPGGYVLLNFENETRAFIDMGDDLGVQPKIEIIGEYGRIEIDELNNKLLVRSRTKNDRAKKKRLYILPNPIIKESNFNFELMPELITLMIKNLISSKKLLVPILDIRDDVELYSAIRKSFDTKNLVKLPIKDRYYTKKFMVT